MIGCHPERARNVYVRKGKAVGCHTVKWIGVVAGGLAHYGDNQSPFPSDGYRTVSISSSSLVLLLLAHKQN